MHEHKQSVCKAHFTSAKFIAAGVQGWRDEDALWCYLSLIFEQMNVLSYMYNPIIEIMNILCWKPMDSFGMWWKSNEIILFIES